VCETDSGGRPTLVSPFLVVRVIITRCCSEVRDEAWGVFSMLGQKFDIFRLRLCYAGAMEFEFDLLRLSGLDRVVETLQKLDRIINLVQDEIIGSFTAAWDLFKFAKDEGLRLIQGLIA